MGYNQFPGEMQRITINGADNFNAIAIFEFCRIFNLTDEIKDLKLQSSKYGLNSL